MLLAQRARLLDWYRASGRHSLPWRLTRDPYAVLVSEVMLQQTQVERVIPKYHEFLAAFPTFAALADAPPAEAIRRWSPLGYNRRAVNLQRAARAAVALGGLPDDEATLRTLPGIGAYTAAAVAAFAFDRDTGVVDTNIRRVLTRAVAGSAATDSALRTLARALVPEGQGRDWSLALMDLGAMLCTARAPACHICPIASGCAYAASPPDPLSIDHRWRGGTRQPGVEANAGLSTPIPPEPVEGRAKMAVHGSTGSPRTVREGSAGYVTASVPFVGSRRYYRGRIVEALRALPEGSALPLPALGAALRPDYDDAHEPWLLDLVTALEADGLAFVEGGEVRLP